MKRLLVYVMAAVMVFTVIGLNPAEASAAPKSKGIEREGSKYKTVYVGKTFDLEVEKGYKLSDNDLWWSVGNSKVVKIVDKDRSDDEIDLKAVGAGKTKVHCKNRVTGNSLYYVVTVKKASKGISRVGDATRSYKTGTEFELAVGIGSAITSNDVKWTIGNTDIVRYDDDDRYDNDMEFYAKKAGTTKIYAKNLKTGNSIAYTIKVSGPASKGIARIGSATKTIEQGDDFEIKVSKGSNLRSDQIKWYISDTSIVRFEDGDRYGTEAEIEGVKRGTTKVYAKNLYTGNSVVYTVKVVPDYDD